MEPSEVRRRLAGYSKSAATLAARQWRTMRTLDDWPKVATRLTVMVQANMVAAARFASREGAWDELGWSEARKSRERGYFEREASADPELSLARALADGTV